MAIFIEINHLSELCGQLLDGHIKYGYGSKAALSATPSEIKEIDCSGFTRYLIYHATDKRVTMVQGSDEQHAWCKKQKLEAQKYHEAASRKDGVLRIAFMPRLYDSNKKLKRAGHVWLIHHGMTIESRGHKGPSRRPWDTSILKKEVGGCYALAKLYQLTAG